MHQTHLVSAIWLGPCGYYHIALEQQFTSRLENGNKKTKTESSQKTPRKKGFCIRRNGRKIFIYIYKETLSSPPTHFSEITNLCFLFIPIGGKNKNPEIYEQCCLFIIQELSSYHMVGKFTEKQSERKLPA